MCIVRSTNGQKCENSQRAFGLFGLVWVQNLWSLGRVIYVYLNNVSRFESISLGNILGSFFAVVAMVTQGVSGVSVNRESFCLWKSTTPIFIFLVWVWMKIIYKSSRTKHIRNIRRYWGQTPWTKRQPKTNRLLAINPDSKDNKRPRFLPPRKYSTLT